MRLAVNIDHIATLRNARNEYDPDPVEAALAAERGGAAGIVCHLREDRRHIRDNDLTRLREAVTSKLDLEMAMTEEMREIALRTRPELVTLVPEKRKELTTEGGFDIYRHYDALASFIEPFGKADIEVSVFIEPERQAIDLAKQAGAGVVELHTGCYSRKKNTGAQETELERIRLAARHARSLGLAVVAGHGLNYRNVAPFRDIEEIEEISIGHAIIARAAFTGLESAVGEMLSLIGRKS